MLCWLWWEPIEEAWPHCEGHIEAQAAQEPMRYVEIWAALVLEVIAQLAEALSSAAETVIASMPGPVAIVFVGHHQTIAVAALD